MTDNRDIAGLPEGAQIQKNSCGEYVFFAYSFRAANGKIKRERDYIGTVRDGRFVPNHFYETCHPVATYRDPERWKNPDRKTLARKEATTLKTAKLTPSTQRSRTPKKPRPVADAERPVGLTALMAGLLRSDGLIEDLCNACSSPQAAIRTVNRAILTTLCAWPDLAACAVKPLLLSDSSAEIDALDIDWCAFNTNRTKQANSNSLLAYDIGIFEPSDEEFETINMLFITTDSGRPVGCQPIDGDTAAFLREYLAFEQRCKKANFTIELITTRSLSDADLLKLVRSKISFLVAGVEADDRIQTFITRHHSHFSQANNYFETRGVYGLKTGLPLHAGNRSGMLHASIFRDPKMENEPAPLANCRPGYFALAGNRDLSPESVLNYQATLSNTGLAFNLSGLSAPSLSSAVAFVSVSIIAILQERSLSAALENARCTGQKLPKGLSLTGAFETVQSITMSRDEKGRPQLHHVSSEARALAKRIGLAGLFDSAENVAEMLMLPPAREEALPTPSDEPVQGTLF